MKLIAHITWCMDMHISLLLVSTLYRIAIDQAVIDQEKIYSMMSICSLYLRLIL